MPKGSSTSVIVVGAILALDVVIAFIPAIALGESTIIPFFRPNADLVVAAESKVDTQPKVEVVATPPEVKTERFDGTPAPTSKDSVDSGAMTAAIPIKPDVLPAFSAFDGHDISLLKVGLDALAAGDVADARLARDKLPSTALDRHILIWAIALSGQRDVTSAEIEAATKTLALWPGAEALRKNGERALYRENPDPKTVISLLAGSAPKTVQGVTVLARAYLATGKPDAARAVLSPFWRTEKLEASDEAAIIKEFAAVLSKADHRFRMEKMFYAERAKSALRVAGLAGAKDLANAWAAVLSGDKQAKKLLDGVPAAQRSAGYFFAKAKYLRRIKKFPEAAAEMLKAPHDKAALVDPDGWWEERRVLARELVDHGDIKTAYKLVAAHSSERPSNVVDAEFHAGWYALRGLRDAKMAEKHFARIVQVSDGPISLSRAYYWLGRSAEAGGPGEAKAYYEKAAAFGTAFYGQLAAARLGARTISVAYPEPTADDHKNFAKREAVRAILRLEEAGYPSRAEILYRDLAQQLTSTGELALLAAMAERRGNNMLALRVGKIAAGRGLDIGALAHPVGAIPASADISGAGTALAYAIARQESEFNVGAVSGAGARGLLQLLPGTAQDMAKKAGMPYSKDRLTSDAAYNAALGSAYLSEQLDRFDGSYVLTFIGYNAGPRRAQDWTKKYGDPRGKDIDMVVDWIERIPFTETRNYVQRVMENYEVYKMRLTGRFDITDDLVKGRRPTL